MANLTTYRKQVQDEVDDYSDRAKTIIDQNIKETYQEILLKTARYISGTTSEQITTVSGTSTTTPTNTYQEVLSVHNLNSNWDLLTQITRDEFLSLHINDSDGTPSRWYMNGSNIELSPAPSTAGTIRVEGVAEPTALSGSTVTSVIPDRFENVVILGAVSRFLGYEKDPLSKDYYSRYQKAFRDMELDLSTRTKTLRPKLWNRTKINPLR